MESDLTIIGSGVIGLSIASELANNKLNIFILEKNESHGRGISSRNSEVIHAGIYYPAGSLKSKLCIEGREMLYKICMKNNIPHKKIGKLIIAKTKQEMVNVENLFQNAINNGVSSLSLLDQGQIKQMEPNIEAYGGLNSPDTGIVCAHSLMNFLLRRAKTNGAQIAYGTEVVGIERLTSGYKITTLNRKGEYFDFVSERVINAAGLQSDRISKMVGMDYSLHYCKGDYFSINNVKSGMVKGLIYPVPEENHVGLGVHLTFDLNGRMKLGPDTAYIDRIEDYGVDISKTTKFYESAVKFLPFIRREDVVPDMSGIRPKIQGPGESFRDFIISEDLPCFVNLIGIESPGLTSALAIGVHVKKMLNN